MADPVIAPLAAGGYAAARPATAPTPGESGGLAGLAQDFAGTLAQSDRVATQALTTGVDPHALVQALTQTELAVEAAVTIRNKVVEAYQEILRMPV